MKPADISATAQSLNGNKILIMAELVNKRSVAMLHTKEIGLF